MTKTLAPTRGPAFLFLRRGGSSFLETGFSLPALPSAAKKLTEKSSAEGWRNFYEAESLAFKIQMAAHRAF
ncbi:hypothetical protein ATPR_2926 [Acetobacter tropicalis NBRC 101654]|uniref:Uncharacterized protein n=1 Tax=Acetobacter tropicalis NBRC 101654 TaxID=749388 RepID=F7VHS7_9PROT|nr:hypothetical protein ATPR_2926 [Acetobacter tropicalis NBRC 101654]